MRLVNSLGLDLALVDISLPDRSGLDLIRDLKLEHPKLYMLGFSAHREDLYAERVLRAGGHGYVSKRQSPDVIMLAIRTVLSGEVYLSKEFSSRLMNVAVGSRLKSDPVNPVSILTDRELEVLQHIGEGLNTRTIAKRMGLSPKTVESHRSKIKDKLQLTDMPDLIRYALQWVEDQ